MPAHSVRIVTGQWTRLAAGLLLLAGTLSIPLVVNAAQEIPLTLEETVRQADAIVLGTVLARQSRWGDATQRWIVTDYTFAVERVLYPSEQGEPIGESIDLMYWGGTMGNETQGISDLRLPVIGERLVVMLRPDWARRLEFSPVIGLNQGLFSIADATGSDRQTAAMLDAGGLPLRVTAGGGIERALAPSPTRNVSFASFENWLAANIARIKATPSQLRAPTAQRADSSIAGFGKMPSFARAPLLLSGQQIRQPFEPADAIDVPAPHTNDGHVVPGFSPAALAPQALPYVTLGPKPNLPIVVNNFPASFAPWSPEDQYQMSKWNYYASGVFRVYTTPTNTFAWRDNVFDLDGWIESTTLQNVYGSGWGSTTIGITFWRSSGGTLVEADIAFNPVYSFTLDDEWVYGGSTAKGFRLVMLHELGHMLGLDHNFNGMAVMNYFPSEFRFFGMPYMDDAAGLRALYPGNAVNRTDLGVYLYSASGYQSVTDATYPSSVVSGGSLTVGDFTIENVGTTTIATPTIEWYLTVARNFNSSYYHLADTTYSPPLPPFTYYNPASVQRTLTIPSNVPPGLYYLAAYVRNDEGGGQSGFPFSNNFAFSRISVAVSVPPPVSPLLVSPTNNATGIMPTPTLTWTTSSDATAYDLYLGKTLSPPFYASIVGTTRRVGVLSSGTTYYWRVVARNSGGSSVPSSTFSFTTAAELPTPTLTSPPDNASDVPRTAALRWNPSSGATSYDVYFGTSSSLVFYTATTGTSVSVGPLAGSTRYYWSVVARNGTALSTLPLAFGFTTNSKPILTHLVFRNTSTGDVAAWLMNGLTLTQSAYINPGLPLEWRIIGIADLDGDGEADLLLRHTLTGDVGVWLMNGTSIAQGALIYQSLPAEWRIEGVNDLNGDRKADLIFRNTNTGDVAAWLMNGAGSTQSGTINSGVPLTWQIDRVGDFDGDGRADIVFRNTATGDVAAWLMNGLTIMQAGIIAAGIPLVWRIDGAGDLNADGRTDLVFRNRDTGDVGAWLMNGLAIEQAGVIAAGIPETWRIDASGDLNGDGRADLVFRDTQAGDLAGWLMNGLGIAQAGVINSGVPLAWQVTAVGDLDGK